MLYEKNEEFRGELAAYKTSHPEWKVIGFFDYPLSLFEDRPHTGAVMVGDQPDASEITPGALPHEIMALRGYDVNLVIIVKELDGKLSLYSMEDLFYIGSCEDPGELPNLH